MADFTTYELSPAPSRDSALFWVQIPSGAPSGYTDYYLDVDALLLAEQGLIAANTAAISALDTRVTTVEDGLTKVPESNKNASFEYTQPANSRIVSIEYRRTPASFTVNPVWSVGYTALGTEILALRATTDSYRIISSVPDAYTTASRTIYFTASTGIIDVVIYLKLNLFT